MTTKRKNVTNRMVAERLYASGRRWDKCDSHIVTEAYDRLREELGNEREVLSWRSTCCGANAFLPLSRECDIVDLLKAMQAETT